MQKCHINEVQQQTVLFNTASSTSTEKTSAI